MDIWVYGGNELVLVLEVFDIVWEGGVELGCGVVYYWVGKIEVVQFFVFVLFGMNVQQFNVWMVSGGLELWEELYVDFNFIFMLGGNIGVQMGGWFNKEINSVEDLKGFKMCIFGLGGKVL